MGFDRLTDILKMLQTRYPQLGRRVVESEALGRWETAVGPAIAKHARAIRVKDGVLMVEVDHPIWRSELHHRKQQILAKLNSGAPQGGTPIEDLFFVSGLSGGASDKT